LDLLLGNKMATYASLTQEQKDVLAAWERNTRGWFNTIARSLMEARALQAALDASGGPREIVTSLDVGEEVPNSSGIAGAQNLTKQELAALVALIDGFITDFDVDAVRQNIAKAAGPTAGL
jgi:hypothetical protein